MTAPATTVPAILDQYTVRLAEPDPPPENEPWAVQSLAEGAAGIALLHTETVSRYGGSWHSAHRWITSAASVSTSARYERSSAGASWLPSAARATASRSAALA